MFKFPEHTRVIPSLKEYDYTSFLKKQHKSSCGGGNLLVIAADVPLTPLHSISKTCYELNIPMISVKSYGFIGCLRVQVHRHTIIESKPDSSISDLRLCHPFPELMNHSEKEKDLSNMDNMEHGHTPFVIILLQALKKWRNGKIPKTLSEKNDFKDMVRSMSRNFGKELNFQEAHRDAYLAYTRTELPDDVLKLIEESCNTKAETAFDVMVAALKRFLSENENEPPLNGSIPDMTSSTDAYIRLQQVYQDKSLKDLQRMETYVEQINSDISISKEELSIFCKNIAHLKILQTSCMEKIESQPLQEEILEDIMASCFDPADPPVHTPLLWYLALRACELFEREYGVYPGRDSRSLALDADVDSVHKILQSYIAQLGLSDVELIQAHLIKNKDIIKEMVRYYNAEIHNIASFMGGVAAQEAVKLITKQFVPLDNVFLFNGIVGVGAVYRL